MAQAASAPGTQPNVKLGLVLVWMAVIIYAASNSIVSLLAEIGRSFPVDGRNAISLCNLLFLGSMISLLPMAVTFWRDWTWENLRKLTRNNWIVLTVSATLSSAVTPGLFFIALDYTTVTNVVLIGRIEPPIFLLAAFVFLKEKLDPWAFAAGLIALLGAVVIILMNDDGGPITIGKGEIAAFFATLSFIASTLVTRVGLQGIPLGIFSIYRTLLGTIIYYFLSIHLYGSDHFQDLFSKVVLQWVWVYAFIVIIVGQFAWTIGLKNARTGDVSLATSFSPVAGLVIAMILLGEDPGPGLIPGGAIVIFAIALGQYGRIKAARKEAKAAEEPAEELGELDQALKAESRVNFKGA